MRETKFSSFPGKWKCSFHFPGKLHSPGKCCNVLLFTVKWKDFSRVKTFNFLKIILKKQTKTLWFNTVTKSHYNLFKDFFFSFKFPCMLLSVRLSEQNICFRPHVQTRVGLYYSSIIYYVVILLVGITRYSDGVLRLTVCAVWTLWSLRCTDNTDNIVLKRSPVGWYPQ